jgi:hypothetical protein
MVNYDTNRLYQSFEAVFDLMQKTGAEGHIVLFNQKVRTITVIFITKRPMRYIQYFGVC